jgi:ABC-type sugar transport system ATPase subunit
VNAVEFHRVSKDYHHQAVLRDVHFAVVMGTFTVIFGPPGCGKSVLLRLLTGLERPTHGKIYMRGEDVTDFTAGERNIGYVPQSFALYPHYRVVDNIAYPLKLIGAPKTDIEQGVKRAAGMLRIESLLFKYPDQLSGGEKQRVALARGITKRSEIYVFDDPLSGLDFKLREQLIDDLKSMQQSLGATFVYTTSDPLEALMLAEQVFFLDKGTIIESGTAEELYYHPVHIRTMEHLGFPKANVLSGTLTFVDGKARCDTELFSLPVRLSGGNGVIEKGRRVTLAMKPEALQFERGKGREKVSFEARIVLREDLGGELIIHLETHGIRLLSVVRQDDSALAASESATVHVPCSEIVLYGFEDGLRIGQGEGLDNA